MPATIHTKVLIAFVGIAVLVLAIGLFGVRVLAQSNDRVGRLGALQVRANAFAKLESDTRSIRLLLNQNPGTGFYQANPEFFRNIGRRKPDEPAIDQAVRNALLRLGPATQVESLGFAPDPRERRVLRQIRATTTRFMLVMERIIEAGEAGIDGTPDESQRRLRGKASVLATDLYQAAGALAFATRVETEDEIADNASSYEGQRNRFVGLAVGALTIALLLGLVLSWSVIGPIRRIDARLAATASGDFSGHVDVSNRDELGALATNVNRMNDELDRLYRELETASDHKSEFLASMSHELRTPLNAIIGFSQVLRERMFGEVNEKQEEYLDDILASAYHLLSLINDVLDLSKVEAGQVELEVAPFSLREALESGVVMVRERATLDGVKVAYSAGPEVDLVDGDERRIRQVIFNLLSNAVKFTPAGGAVDVSAAQVNGEVRVSVADTGPGLAPGITTGSSRSSSRPMSASSSTRVRVSVLPSRSGWSSCTAAESGWTASSGKGSTFVFTLPTRSS